MNNPVTLSADQGVALIRIDNPPVNALSPEVISGLDAAVDQASGDPAVRAIVIIGAGRTFVAGADIKGLEQLAWGSDSGAPEIHDLLQKLDDGGPRYTGSSMASSCTPVSTSKLTTAPLVCPSASSWADLSAAEVTTSECASGVPDGPSVTAT